MSLKALAEVVLKRNRTSNLDATDSKSTMQPETHFNPSKDAQVAERWNPELAAQGYVWCLDCKHFDSVNCKHADNPFHTIEKQPAVPRKCQWYEDTGGVL